MIRAWWQQWPHANVGLQTGQRSQFVVLDVDPYNGGTHALEDLTETYGPLPETAPPSVAAKAPITTLPWGTRWANLILAQGSTCSPMAPWSSPHPACISRGSATSGKRRAIRTTCRWPHPRLASHG